MSIKNKLKLFLSKNHLTYTEVAFMYGVSQQTITNYMNGKREIPLAFIIWLKKTYPDINLNSLFSDDYELMVSEPRENYGNEKSKAEALKEIGEIMDKYF